MGSLTIRALAVGVFLTTLLTIAMEVDSVQVRPMYGRPGPPSTTLRMRRDPPSKSMMMMSPNGARSPPSRRQFYNNHYRQLQRPRKSPPPTQFHYGQPPKRIAHASYSTHKSHYVPFPKQEYGSRRPTYKYSPVGNRGPPKYHRPAEAPNMKPHHTFGDSFPTKTKYNNNGFQKDFVPSRRPPQHTPTPSPVSFPSAISDNAQVIKGTREKPTYQQNYAKPSYNSYIATTEQSSHSDYFAAPVSTSFHAVEPSHHSSSQLSSATYGSPTKVASEASKGLQSSIASFPNSPPVPQAFAVSNGSPAVSYSYIEHGSSGQQPAASNYGVAASATQKFQAPASQSFGFVPYSDNGQSQGLTQTVQFPSSIVGGQRPARKSQKTGESHILSPNYYDSSSSHSISVSASIPAFESHTSFDQSDATSQVQSSSNDERYTQVAYPSNHRSSYEPSN